MDFAVSSSSATKFKALLVTQGYLPDQFFNGLHGATRLYYQEPAGRWSIDVVIDELVMSHKLDLRGRLDGPEPTVTLADLLLTKLQVWEINRKDLGDALCLLADHSLTEDDSDAEGVSLPRLRSVLGKDWGFCHTFERNARKVGELWAQDRPSAARARCRRAGRRHCCGRSRMRPKSRALEAPESSRRAHPVVRDARGGQALTVVELKDHVVVITGGASGIGAASCRAFAAGGARVAVVDRNRHGADAVAEEIGGVAFECDVSDEAAVNRMVTDVEAQLGPIDILFSNAGIATGADILSTPTDEWNNQWAINVMAHVYGVRAVLPGMLARGSGYLVHTASMAGILTSHGNVLYATTKHAVVGLAEWLSITYHHRGIRVSLIAPLGVRTPMFEAADPSFAAMVAGPIKEPEEVADSVVDAVRTERFLVISDPIAQTWMQRKTDDEERWLRGMRRVQEQMEGLTGPTG